MSKQVNQVKLGAEFIADTPRRLSNDRCLWAARMRRDRAALNLPEWEDMRSLASEIKKHTLSNLDRYLEQFEQNLTGRGIHVHWAETDTDHNDIVLGILRDHGVRSLTKGKSMAMDECRMREYLEKNGIEVYESDLGERIQQLDNQRDSHIVMPAIHKLRTDVAKLFARELGSDPDNDDPKYLNGVMRRDMRPRYIAAGAGMIGCNFAVAETGTIVMCSNEGDVDICATLPPLLIVTVGIEKLIPRQDDLSVFIRLLSRSSLGYDITQYTSHISAPAPGQEIHVVMLDNGRSERIGQPYWEIMKCIRCGTCMNTCPVFRRTSGISYDANYPGPLGLVLEPSYDLHRYAQLPFSCTHCGSCGNVCPVKIPLPELILRWREVVVANHESLLSHDIEEGLAGLALRNSTNFSMAERLGLAALRILPKSLAESKLNPWAEWHANPEAPEQTFRQWYESQKNDSDQNKDNEPYKETNDEND
ncbi:MAG: LUD domain-containing protein [Clostridium sp.]|nr:LUD domain-containing protein [Clostridium sp.]